MKIISVSEKNTITEAVKILKKGGIIIYPSESSYGIGCDAANKKAINKIIKLKQRPVAKKMIAYVSSASMAEKYCGKKLTEREKQLLRKFPGRLTLIKNKKSFRIPSHPFPLILIKKFGKPVITTSANVSERPPIYNISEIKKKFSGKVDLIVDAGLLPKRKPSTIFDVDKKKILRKGPISFSQIKKV